MRITIKTMVDSMKTADRIMSDTPRFERRINEINTTQPILFGMMQTVINMEDTTKLDTLWAMRLLIICCEAMDRSPFTWDEITSEDMEKHSKAVLFRLANVSDLANQGRLDGNTKVSADNPEKHLNSYLVDNFFQWQEEGGPDAPGNHALMCTLTFVECIGHGSAERRPKKRRRGKNR